MEEILRILRERENFVLAGHIGPDGDAIASCFALALALDKMGKNVQVVLEPFAHKFKIIPGQHFLFSGDLETLQPEVFIALDCADPERLGAARAIFECAPVTVCIDHHETNQGFAVHNYIEPAASSTSELTLRVIERFTELTAEIAAAVYAGMVSDTGGFRYNATAKSTMETAARLMEQIPFTQIYNVLMYQHRFQAGKALGIAAENSARSEDKKIIYSHITCEMLASVGAVSSDLDCVVEYLMGTRGALAAVFVYETAACGGVDIGDTCSKPSIRLEAVDKKTTKKVKVSLRSQGPNMGRVAVKLGGGGHALAAGATVEGTIFEVLERTLALVTREVAVYDGR